MTILTVAAAKLAAARLIADSCVSEGELVIGGNVLEFTRDGSGSLVLTHIETLKEAHDGKPIKPDENSEVRRAMAKRQKRQERLRRNRRGK